MTKREMVIGAIGFGVAVVLAGGGLLWHNHQTDQRKKAELAAKQAQARQTVGDHTIPLTATSEEDKRNGLSVSDSGSALGQLEAKEESADQPSGGQTNPFDPATFKQYDKYKSAQGGLFAEVQKGTGKELTAGHKAAVLYRGWLTDGTLFDQSRAGSDGKLQPFVFTLGARQVISGWDQALAGMKVGGVRLVIVPPAAGYGSKQQGPIPPNSVLIFQVQLLEVQ